VNKKSVDLCNQAMLSIDDRNNNEYADVYDMSRNLANDPAKSYAQSIFASLLYQKLLNKP